MTNKRTPKPEWPWRLVLIIVGVGLILRGRGMLHQGYLWVAGFDARFGRIAHRPSVDYIVIGLFARLDCCGSLETAFSAARAAFSSAT